MFTPAPPHTFTLFSTPFYSLSLICIYTLYIVLFSFKVTRVFFHLLACTYVIKSHIMLTWYIRYKLC